MDAFFASSKLISNTRTRIRVHKKSSKQIERDAACVLIIGPVCELTFQNLPIEAIYTIPWYMYMNTHTWAVWEQYCISIEKTAAALKHRVNTKSKREE